MNTAGNFLERAAACDDRNVAASLILTALHIKSEAVALATLPEPAEWKALPVANRLQELASWLAAECHDAIDRAQENREGERIAEFELEIFARDQQTPPGRLGQISPA